MINKFEIVHLTPIEEIFPSTLLYEIMFKVKPQKNMCYMNSINFANYVKDKYTSIGYCEGIIYKGHFVHAFNSIIIKGKKHYVDFSGYFYEKMYGYKRQCNICVVLREYTPRETSRKFKKMVDNHHALACTIDIDGTFLNCLKEIREYAVSEDNNADYTSFLDRRIEAATRSHEHSKSLR